MKTCAIVSEYNPFHNGHGRQIEILRKEYGITHVIGIMSGNFTQRGMAAVLDKFTRSHMAILGGIDLVLELPTLYATSSAEFFSFGATSIMESLSNVDYISFGAETEDLSGIKSIAKILNSETHEFSNIISKELKLGLNFPQARQNALKEILGIDKAKILEGPNNILAVEYIRSLMKLNSKIEPILIKREGLGYHDLIDVYDDSKPYPSATALREIINNFNLNMDLEEKLEEKLKGFMSEKVLEVLLSKKESLLKEETAGKKIMELFLYRISMDKSILSKIPEGRDGLGDRILLNIDKLKGLGLKDSIDLIQTRRFTATRIRRLILHTILHFDLENYEVERKESSKECRILALNEKGMEFLSETRKTRTIKLLDTLAQSNSHITSYDIKSSYLYSLLNPEWKQHFDFTKNPLIIK